jgi:hypothetical protein
MNPFKNIRKWTRKNFPDPDTTKGLRHLAEIETDRDLQKPVQQLMCDVHEESLNPLPAQAPGESDEHWYKERVLLQLQRLIGAHKRMVSLQAVSTFRMERTNILVFWLTCLLVVQTAFLIWITVFPRQTTSPTSPPLPLIKYTGTNNESGQK